jgi:hypothetical protein
MREPIVPTVNADPPQLMLVAMTYNTYLCTAIVVGAFVGHYVYEGEVDLK